MKPGCRCAAPARVKCPWRLPTLLDSWGGGGGTVLDARIRLPPLPPGMRFESAYDVVLLIDNREQVCGRHTHCMTANQRVGRLQCK